MSLMNFTASTLGRVLRLRLSVSRFVDSGEFDVFIDRLLGEIDRHDAPLVVLDLAEVDYFASAMLGLLVNIRQRVRALGGKLVIQTERTTLDSDYCATHVDVRPGDYVLLTVRDSGCGMTQEVRAHLFEPFFTTKEKGKGTGLGLSTVYGIVRQCHGHIDVETAPGMGTEFRIYFPRLEAPSEAAAAESVPGAVRGSETILVVEDEYAVRVFTVRVLKGLGYQVLEAGNAGDALAICERHRERIDLIMTDLVMPQVSGTNLVEHVRHLRSDFRVLYTTGFAQDAISHHGLGGSEPILMKPYTRELLARKVREVLDAP